MKKKLVFSFVAFLMIASVVMLSIPPKAEAWSPIGEVLYAACLEKCYYTGLEVNSYIRPEFSESCLAKCDFIRCVY